MKISLHKLLILTITLLALVLGGTTQLWEQATIGAAMALFLLIVPPQRNPPRIILILAGSLFLLALLAFLPPSLGFTPSWRSHLINDLHLDLPDTRTPQPWVTLQACCLLFIGLFWAVYLFSVRWDAESRVKTAQVLVLGISLLSAVAVAAFFMNFHIPIWDQEENRGWFPNRNQTADVLVLAGILNYALIFDRLRKRRGMGFVLLLAILPIAAGLVVSYSRAGILLFFGGILLWHLLPGRPSSSRSSRERRSVAKWPVFGATLLLILLTLFFTFGGATLSRFNQTIFIRPGATELRFALQQDALRFSSQSPLLGIGLGNFESLFAMERHLSIEQNRAVHPESDWLWAACELGWLAPMIFLTAIVWWLRHCLPYENLPGESFRRAVVVATTVFILHGVVDVAGHRLGSLCVGLLLASMALPPSLTQAPSRILSVYFRGAACVVLLICFWWTGSLLGLSLPPTSAALTDLNNQIRLDLASRVMSAAEDTATRALKIAPLDARLYFDRGYAEAFQEGGITSAAADFQIARALNPHWMPLCLDEGVVWIEANEPDRCLDAFTEALNRATENQGQLYFHMLQVAERNPLVHSGMGDLAADHPDYLVIFINSCSRDESKHALDALLARDPNLRTLSSAQREQLFHGWWYGGDRPSLLDGLNHHTDWINEGWPYLAQSWADQKDFEQAWKLVAGHATPPSFSSHVSTLPLSDLEQDFYSRPNVPSGMMLYLSEIQQGKNEDALAAVRAMEKLPKHPAYLGFLEARLWAEKGEWELAWNAWQQSGN